MSQAHGYNTWLGWGKESTYGTAVTASKYIEIEKESLRETRKFIQKPILRYLSRSRKIAGKQDVQGSISAPLMWTGMEHLLENVMGVSSFATTGTNPYTHTGALKAAVPVGLTMVVNRDSEATGAGTCYRYTGCQINKLTLSQKVEEFLMIEAEILGVAQTQFTKPTPSFPTFDPVDYSQVTIAKINPASANVTIPIRSLSITIDNKYAADGYRLGSSARQVMNREGQREVSFEFECELTDDTIVDYYQALTETDLQFKWVKDGNTDLTITMPKVVFDGENPVIDGPGFKLLKMSGVALLSAADNDEIAIVLKNATSAPFA
jgi:hypothetical protein